MQDNVEAKILGLNWDTKQDKFYFDFKQLITYVQSLPPTKRSILRATAKLFDPLGFLSPLIIGTKILFQELCKDKLGWDDKLEGSALKRWNQLKVDLSELSQIKVNRCYYDNQHIPTAQQIHGFSDASQRAYAAVVYLRTVYSDGGVSTCLVASKSRVAPMKEQTIPRLELLGATILAHLVDSVLSYYQFKPEVYCWTDSYTVLCWIKNEDNKQWKQYVQHRVSEINRLTNKNVWRFCPGSSNPADIPSRSCSTKDLTKLDLWWMGPDFLTKDIEEWPDMPTLYNSEASGPLIIASIR